MSLMARAQATARFSGDDAGAVAAESMADRLRSQMQAYLTVDELASLVDSNPGRARSEIKSACRQAFEAAAWASLDRQKRENLVGQVIDQVLGFGPLERMLEDESITEIMVNGPQSVFIEREGKLQKCTATFTSADQLRALIDRILGPLGRRIDELSPMVSARLPQGHRVNAVIAPLALDGPVLTIRKFAARVLTLQDMVASGSLEKEVAAFLTNAVRGRKSLAVSGGTGSGKTTLLNALSCEIPFGERIITIEDSAELRFLEHPHVVRLEARPRNAEGAGEVSICDLVVNALRMRPDRIVVGECRGAEALDMLQAMNTGHDGSLTTLHANTPADAVSRLTTMVRYAADLPVDVIETQIACAFDYVVQIARDLEGHRFLTEIAAFSFDGEGRHCQVETLYSRPAFSQTGTWQEEARDVGEKEPEMGKDAFPHEEKEVELCKAE